MSLIENYWGKLDVRKRFALLCGLLLIAVVVTLLCVWVFKANYAVLFNNLNDADAATITAELDELKIPYRLGEGGSAILVDRNRVHDARLKLTASGVLVKGGVGFELFDNAEYGMTDFAQKINYQRALQGELARTIMSIAEVRQARVHLVLPESSLFRRNQQRDVSASISLITAPGATLSREQILGIQRLVAAAVKDLEYRDVVISDQNGLVLTANKPEDAEEISGRLDKKKKIEDYLTRKVRRILDRVFGPGQGVVNVDVTINYDQVERQVEEVVPTAVNNRGVISRSLDTKVRKSAVAGQSADSAAQGGDVLNESREVEYKLGKAVERVIHSVGNISGISASVLVPPTASEADISALRGLIRTALGAKATRGDSIEIQALARKQPDSFAGSETSLPGTSVADTLNAEAIVSETSTSVQRTAGAEHDKLQGFHAWIGDWSDYPPAVFVIVSIAVLALVFVAAFAIFAPAAAGGRRKERLDTEGREAVLQELKNWLNSDAENPRDYPGGSYKSGSQTL